MARVHIGILVTIGIVAMANAGAGLAPCIACMSELCPAVLAACTALGFTPLVCACIGVGCGATCATACAFIAAGCFDEATFVVTPSGSKRIAEVVEGDWVLGLGNKFTLVTHVQEYVGEFDMVTIGFADPVASLTATGAHWHFAKTVDGGLTPVEGANVTLGTEMLRNPPMGNSRIVSLAASKAPRKYSITTEACSLYANGVLTGSTCANATTMLYQHQLQVAYADYFTNPNLDADQDGYINMDEMESHVSDTAWVFHQSTTNTTAPPEQMESLFKTMDVDHDGFVETEELLTPEEQKRLALVPEMAESKFIGDSTMHIRRVGLDRADKSGDNQLSFEEFSDYVRGIRFAFQAEFSAAYKEQHKGIAAHHINKFDIDNDHRLSNAEIQHALQQLLKPDALVSVTGPQAAMAKVEL